ncbi:hypothetical protein OH76DRAFT_1396079 [Lentinus brumalis]|uniref:Uncharacterized protein n=1 Tax=Lentinus brumalis TaxID=2498619 RepID=A0A371CHP0_9APHY|nr:hypothetical protein OH76DRAFT_1413346 [Polyporus brumalis]RDX56918.1 hypothetical protein OH76DRAFT_1396079 [Polyporus brumalis]
MLPSTLGVYTLRVPLLVAGRCLHCGIENRGTLARHASRWWGLCTVWKEAESRQASQPHRSFWQRTAAVLGCWHGGHGRRHIPSKAAAAS